MRTSRTVRATVAATISAAALSTVALAAPAQAATRVVTDPADATASLTDIRSVRVVHGDETVRVVTTFTDLRWRNNAGATVFIDSNPDRRGPELALGGGLAGGTDYFLVRVRGWRQVGEPVECPHSSTLQPARDRMVVEIDRGCFYNRASVRVGVRMTDYADSSHPVTDWLRGPRRFTGWVASS